MQLLLGQTPSKTPALKPFEGLFTAGMDCVSIQFAIHYFMRDAETLDVLCKNLQACTKTGSVVMGTCMDGAKMYAELLAKDTVRVANPASPDLTAVSITRDYDPAARPWTGDGLSLGMGIKVWVETFNAAQTEYLVPFEHLEAAMKGAGFDLLQSDSFQDLFPDMHGTMTTDQKHWSLLHRTFAFVRRDAAAADTPAPAAAETPAPAPAAPRRQRIRKPLPSFVTLE
jgi:hypothetical protein